MATDNKELEPKPAPVVDQQRLGAIAVGSNGVESSAQPDESSEEQSVHSSDQPEQEPPGQDADKQPEPIAMDASPAPPVDQLFSLDDIFSQIKKQRIPTKEEETSLGRLIAAEDKAAIQELVERNMAMVIAIARRFINQGLPMVDLVQAGNLGLLKASQKFDYKEQKGLYAYAKWWVRQEIDRSVAEGSSNVRIPQSISQRIPTYIAISMRLIAESGTEPTEAEIAHEMKVDVTVVQNIKRALLVKSTMSIETDEEEEYSAPGTVRESELPDDVDRYEEVDRALLIEQILKSIDKLDLHSQQVLCLIYGLKGHEQQTITAIAEAFGVNRRTIEKNRDKALEKLREAISLD